MNIDGVQLAETIRGELKHEIEAFERPLRLGFVRSGTDMVAKKFVAIKMRTAEALGVEVFEIPLSEHPTTEEALSAVRTVALESDGLIVQMPLPIEVDVGVVIATIPTDKDVDAMHGGGAVYAPVVAAMKEILERNNIPLEHKKVVVVGSGRLVGAPAALWCKEAGAEVSVCTRESGALIEHTKDADIIILGAGKAGILTPDMIKEDVVILDAGTSEDGGSVLGDADPSCAQKAALFTPVPRGIGPIAVTMIFKNLLTLAKQAK